MTKTSYTAGDIKKLKKAYPFLKKGAQEKYAKYKSRDPFPMVGEALLNSADLLMYLLTVGIVEPFDEKKLKGVTYQCTFSGEAHRFDPETGGMKEIGLVDGQELVLEKNSITYLKIEEKFRVPEYMALRFNVSVSNAYKGLLVGTGPIVDPGFEGNLFIPLHNLTGNEYIIKKGASLIRVEFTKLSRHTDWDKKGLERFQGLSPITKKTPWNASFSSFFEEALLDPDKKLFYTKGASISVRSSIPDAIADSAGKAEEAQKSANAAAKTAEKMWNWSLAGIIGVVVALAAMVFSVLSLVHDASARYDSMAQDIIDCKQQIYELTQQLEEARDQLSQYKTAYPQWDEQDIEGEASKDATPLPPSSSGESDGSSDNEPR